MANTMVIRDSNGNIQTFGIVPQLNSDGTMNVALAPVVNAQTGGIRDSRQEQTDSDSND